MNEYGMFFVKFMEPLFEGISKIFSGLFKGILEMFNIINYINVIKEYAPKMGGLKVIVIGVSVILLLAIFGCFFFLIYKSINTYIKYRRNLNREDLLIEELENLNHEVSKLRKNNINLTQFAEAEVKKEDESDTNKNTGNRFYKLANIDKKYENYEPIPIENNFTLEELCVNFRNYCASQLHLYYDINLIRLFISAFASNKIIILEGISGTGKTSLVYAFGTYIKNNATVASVQPSWHDSTEIFGYFNEFTKKFNETSILEKLYEAKYRDEMFITLLDEMNMSRVEYYFAEMLSVLELPNHEDWVIELVPNGWPTDPKNIIDGKLYLPDNMWFIGTINNDDSSFSITDKVYDRAMPLGIDDKFPKFDAPAVEAKQISFKYFTNLINNAIETYKVSEESNRKIEELDSYVKEHFKVAVGNRIFKQLHEFVPTYVACGGSEIDGIDYVIAHKIFKKFEQLNLAYFKEELNNLIIFMDKLFGTDTMKECKATLLNMKKNF